MSVPINTAPQRCVTHEFLMGYHACGFQNPQDFIFLSDDILGFLRFEVRVHKYTFLFVGTHFKTGWDSKGTAVPLALGHPIGARSALLDGDSKGDSVPLAGGIQWRAAPLSGRKNPMKPAVSWHTILFARSSVLYLWRPWVAERGCSGQEQALSASHRTGGFCVLPDEKPRSLL